MPLSFDPVGYLFAMCAGGPVSDFDFGRGPLAATVSGPVIYPFVISARGLLGVVGSGRGALAMFGSFVTMLKGEVCNGHWTREKTTVR